MQKIILALLILTSCAGPARQGLEKRQIENYYVDTGSLKYFLPKIPTWIHFSNLSSCSKKNDIAYLDFAKVNQSLALGYEEVAQLQYLYNRKLNEIRSKLNGEELTLKAQEKIFLSGAEQVSAGAREFILPKYKKINLIWIDESLSDENIFNKVKKFKNSNAMDLGYPVFISECLGKEELSNYIKKAGYSEGRFISNEMFSIYNSGFEQTTHFTIDVNAFFGSDYQIYLYSNDKNQKVPFTGDFIKKEF